MRKVCLLNLLFYCLILQTRAQDAFTLQEAQAYALKNNHKLQIQRTDVLDVNEQIREYLAIGLPKLSASASYNYFLKLPTSIFPNFIEPAIYDVLFDENLLPRRDRPDPESIPVQFGTKHNVSAGLNLNTMLFDGSFLVGLKGMRMYRDLIGKQIQQSEADVRYQISKAYLASLQVRESIKIIKKNLSNLEKVKNEVSEIYKAGFTEKLDVERLELSLQNLMVEKEKLEKIQRITENVLKFQMNYPLEKSILLSDQLDQLIQKTYLEVMDPSIQLQIENRPEYPVIMQGIKLAEINIKRYKSTYLPSLTGFASYQQSLQRNKLFDSKDNGWFPTSNLGVNFSWPLFTGFDRKAKVQRASIVYDKSKMQYAEFEMAAKLEFENAKTAYLNALLSLDARKKSLQLAEKIYETSRIKFKEGVGSSLETTSAERDLYQSQANLMEAQVNLIQAKIDMDKSLGKL